jgi:small-conductance mechanosensitive channel
VNPQQVSVGDPVDLSKRLSRPADGQPKFITVTRLIVSGVTFAIYFFALGLILQELGVNLTAYFASASVIGLAISFGLQGLVQDIVSGLTLIFWDVMDVGDLVEISGSTTNVAGRVEEIGLRYTKLVNFNKQEVYVPNRVIANVSRFPRGGLDAYGDVQIPAGADEKKAVEIITRVAKGMWGQFGAIILSEPQIIYGKHNSGRRPVGRRRQRQNH